MNLETGNLAVTDPLAEKEVTIVIRVLPDNAQRPARTALVSAGTSGQLPVFVSGIFEDVADLIRRAWLAYGVQAEVRQAAVEDVGRTDVETVVEAVVSGADDSDGDETPPAAPTQLQPAIRTVLPKSQPQNLSLF